MAVSRDLLSIPLRLYIYGLHGFFTEVIFTAIWDFVLKQDFRLHGCTSVWSLFIYAVGVFVNERLFLRMRGSVPLLARGAVYVTWTYTWEYSTGRVLDFFGARPWDYTELQYNIHGLIALEFAPLWYVACLVSEQMLIRQILTLTWDPTGIGRLKDKPPKVKAAPAQNGAREEKNGVRRNRGKSANGRVASKAVKKRNGQGMTLKQTSAKCH
ncbi:transmembrane protein 229B-like [Pollicipes pollicipes]|uniref:transmembrane protein 229B-like n=1 Tax=Pollicipes pollicipes TaxID=41117 RepID=UPI001884C52E|nr:transmembrane protein 229B-like [Pollicipes pollicipes]XP_037072884.1 transmembrane protein 229B-like [Pollicipes pollicipes]